MSSQSPHDDHDNGKPDDHASHHDTIRIIVVTTADDLDRRFNRHEPLRVVFERALSLVGGHGQAEQFVLHYGDQPLTELDRTLGELAHELGWGDRVELELVPRPVVV
jgi:hypothetical protein